jgi:hypothetical protein
LGINPLSGKSALTPHKHSVYRTFSRLLKIASLYLGMNQLMAGGGVALIGLLLVPQLTGLFG